MLPRERTKILLLPVTPTEWLPVAEKSTHRLLLNSPTMELSACLGAWSSLRNCDRLCHGKTTCLPFSCPSRLFQSQNSHTDGACFRGKEQNIFTYRSHQRSGSLIRREEHSPPLVELTYISVRLGAGSSLRTCDRLCHGKST